MTDFPEELGEDPKARDEARRDWLEEVEDEYIAQGDISVSETLGGHNAAPDLDDEDEFDDELHENMHEEFQDEEDYEDDDDPYDEDEDPNDDEDEYDDDDEI
jgi:hypothetical protein